MVSAFEKKLFLISPFFLFLAISTCAVVVNLIFFSDWKLSHYLYVVGAISFLTTYGYVVVLYKVAIGSSEPKLSKFSFSENILRYYIWLGFIGAVIGGVVIFHRGFSGAEGLFFNLRYAHTKDQESLYGASQLALFSLVVSGVKFLDRRFMVALAAFFLYLIPSFAAAERTSILYGFTFLMYLAVATGYLNLKYIVGFFLALIVIFISIALSSEKLYVNDVFFLLPYLGFGITAFDDWVLGHSNSGCSGLIFGSFGNIADYFSGRAGCSDMDFAPDGLFNVYTYVANPYLWGGEGGIVFLMAGLGCFYAILKIKEKCSYFFLMLNACLIFSVVIVFYAWTFTLTTHMYMAILLTPVFYGFNVKKLRFFKY
jgi:oligosaccharide repeat unit polymerase